MAARVSSEEVLEIIDTDLTDVSAMITAANLIINSRLASRGISEELLKEIERWLAAHFVAIRDPKLKSETIDGAKQEYEYAKMGEGIMGTSYGQQAVLLDVSGSLAQMGKKRATIVVDDFRDSPYYAV
jgi:hypothetical protein